VYFLLIGLSIIEGGERPDFLDSILQFSAQTEARHHFVKGLKRTGIWQVCSRYRVYCLLKLIINKN